jgi:hypothetical protein
LGIGAKAVPSQPLGVDREIELSEYSYWGGGTAGGFETSRSLFWEVDKLPEAA